MTLEAKDIVVPLLDWYARHRRDLPWRSDPTPYRVWLSEIMLQQTTVPAVAAYFETFTRLWPDLHALAAAPVEDVMHAWAGLGYYSRARNLHACARVLAATGGSFPRDETTLKSLPGIGEYTASAIRAIAFHEKACVIDGNVERVISRLHAIRTPLPASKVEIREKARTLYLGAANTDPAALPQAFMDLGATVCIPAQPRCGACPLAPLCAARASGTAAALPARAPKKTRPQKKALVYWVEDGHGSVLVERRPPRGLLGGMLGLPGTLWSADEPVSREGFEIVRLEKERVKHVFTHFELNVQIARARVGALPEGCFYIAPDQAGFPSLYKKIYNLIRKKD